MEKSQEVDKIIISKLYEKIQLLEMQLAQSDKITQLLTKENELRERVEGMQKAEMASIIILIRTLHPETSTLIDNLDNEDLNKHLSIVKMEIYKEYFAKK